MLSLGACNTRKESDIPDTPDTPTWGETSTKEIVFKGDKVRSGLGSGSQLGTNAFDTALTSLINSQADNTLTALGGQKCGTQFVGGDDKTATETSLTVGTSSYDGLIYFTFDLEIVQIDAVLQNYYKPYSGGMSLDVDAEVVMCSYNPTDGVKESKEVNLATEDKVSIPAERNETLEFKESTNTIAFYNNASKHRTYIHSLTITYLVE